MSADALLVDCRRCCGVRLFGIGCTNPSCFEFRPEAVVELELGRLAQVSHK